MPVSEGGFVTKLRVPVNKKSVVFAFFVRSPQIGCHLQILTIWAGTKITTHIPTQPFPA